MTTRVPYSMTDAPVNVKAYGAKGDGVTNDRAAIQAAIDAGAGTIYFPKGSYLVNTGLTIPSGCHLEFGTGAPAVEGLLVDVERAQQRALADELDRLGELAQGLGVDLQARALGGAHSGASVQGLLGSGTVTW